MAGKHDKNLARIEQTLRDWTGPAGTSAAIAKRAELPPQATLRALRALQVEGKAALQKGRWSLAEQRGTVRGSFLSGNYGDGFVRVFGQSEQGDIYIPKSARNGAMHGDEVLVRIEQPGIKPQGRVTQTLRRGHKLIAGVLAREGPAWRVTPYSGKLPSLYVAAGPLQAAEGDLVLARISRYPRRAENPTASIEARIGRAGDPAAELYAMALSRGFDHYSAEEREACQAGLSEELTEGDLAGRADYREAFCMTIDGADAKDFDDAVAIAQTDDGYTLWVHIADVSHYVKPHTALDRAAVKRGTSLYLPGLTLPMLPEALSNGACSLLPGQDRLCFTAELRYNAAGQRTTYALHRSVIRSRRRMTYAQCNAMLSGDEALRADFADVYAQLESMHRLALLLRKQREASGGLDLDLRETAFTLDEADADVLSVGPRDRGESQRIIEDFMVAANQAAAHCARTHDAPCAYRVHEEPTYEKLREFAAFAADMNLPLAAGRDGRIAPSALQQVLAQAQTPIVARTLLRCLPKADYRPDPLGHYGLGLADYCHFTAPIRRYPDIIVHRALAALLAGDTAALETVSRGLTDACDEASRRERDAVEAEREADDYRKAQYMQRFVGEVFTGSVTGFSRWGMFIALPNTCEGVVPLATMADDDYEFDPDRRHVVGDRTRRVIRPGDAVNVRIARVAMGERRVYMEEVR